jgi:hypothetical protein
MKKPTGKVNSLLKRFDQYGYQVQLNADSTSAIGGLVTICAYGLITAYFLVLLKDVIAREGYSVNSGMKQLRLDDTTNRIGLNDADFDLAVTVRDSSGKVNMTALHRYFSINVVYNKRFGETYSLPLVPCNSSNFQGVSYF